MAKLDEIGNVVTDCVRCDGRGTIPCPACAGLFGVNLTPYGTQCGTCKGVRELQCPACHGRAKIKLPDTVDTMDVLRESKTQQVNDRKSDFTTARQVLAVHNLLDAANADLDNKAAEVRLIEFLTGKNSDAIRTKLTEIRERGNPSEKRSKKAVPRSPKSRKEDLRFIKPFFETLRLTKVVNAIDDEIKGLDQDD